MKAILHRYDLDLQDIEVEVLKIEGNLYYCSDGSRVTKEMLNFEELVVTE